MPGTGLPLGSRFTQTQPQSRVSLNRPQVIGCSIRADGLIRLKYLFHKKIIKNVLESRGWAGVPERNVLGERCLLCSYVRAKRTDAPETEPMMVGSVSLTGLPAPHSQARLRYIWQQTTTNSYELNTRQAILHSHKVQRECHWLGDSKSRVQGSSSWYGVCL